MQSQSCRDAVQWAVERLNQGGLQVLQTFNLEDARGADTPCTCPYHGTHRCDCQMVVLLVYGNGDQPVSLMVHGHDREAWLSLVENPDGCSPELEGLVREILMLSD